MQYFPVGVRRQADLKTRTSSMKLKSSLLLFSFLGVLGVAFIVQRTFNTQAAGTPEHDAALMQALLRHLSGVHFQPKPIDDNLSKSVFNLYLKDIDGGKRFFNRQDIEQLSAYELKLDDEAQAGTFVFFDLSVQLLEKSLDKTQAWYSEALAGPLDYSVNDALESDGDKLAWAKNDAELRARWVSWMKYEVLNRISDEQEKQSKPDFKGEKKDFSTLESEMRAKVLDTYDKWFKRLKKLDRNRRMEIYLNSFTNVFDPHSGYFSPQEKENFDIQMSGKLEGIGARLQSDGEKTKITEVVPGGPAWKQGDLQAEDVVLKVSQGSGDGEFLDIMGWEIDDVVSKIRGPKGTQVTLFVQKADGTERTITITRDVVIMEEGLAKSLILGTEAHGADKIGYIFLPKFYADFTSAGATSCAADVKKELDKLKAEQVRGIILDLRGNGGGSLRDVVQMSGFFVENGPIVQVKSRNRSPEIMTDNDSRVQWDGPLVVMVNGMSASASEILAAAESVKPLGQTKLTMQKFYRVSGKTTQLVGVEPDIVLPDFYNLLENGESENDYPLETTTIDPVEYSQKVYKITDLNQLRLNSAARVDAIPVFRKIGENAVRIRKLKDQTVYPLQKEKFEAWHTRMDEEAKRFDNLFSPVEGFTVRNLMSDLTQIESDTSRQARNESWLKDRKKDVQLKEAVEIVFDMIRMDIIAGKQ
ncbi:MAG: carboxy terminal-processing peptidase [Saprospiraceae bacterium]|nr:carboxy terminal-processing peptidase [Saprospiraceae bacterium]